MRAIGTPPEADLRAVANGDFSRLSQPLLIAAATRSQFEDFIWREGLMCTEVRRFREPRHHRHHPEGKILLLLPGCQRDFQTAAALEWWVNEQDRYTVQLDGPRPIIPADPAGRQHLRNFSLLFLACSIAWALLVWLIYR